MTHKKYKVVSHERKRREIRRENVTFSGSSITRSIKDIKADLIFDSLLFTWWEGAYLIPVLLKVCSALRNRVCSHLLYFSLEIKEFDRFPSQKTSLVVKKKKRGGRCSCYQNDHGVVQRSVCVQRLHVPVNDVMPLHPQVNETLGFELVSFPVEDVVSCCLVLDGCNQSLRFSY